MSDKPRDERQRDLATPPELVACEQYLARMKIPRSRLDRDALMYRAGWAAAEGHGAAAEGHGAAAEGHGAAAEGHATPVVHQLERWGTRRGGGRLRWMGSLTSAAVAAALAAAMTHHLERLDRGPVGRPPSDAPAVAAETPSAVATPPTVSADRPTADPPTVDPPRPARQPPQAASGVGQLGPRATGTPQRTWDPPSARDPIPWSAPVLAMRHQALTQSWDDAWWAPPRTAAAAPVRRTSSDRPTTPRALLKELLEGAVSGRTFTGHDEEQPRNWQSIDPHPAGETL